MPQASAGALIWRRGQNSLEVLLAHPGGPFWRRKDEGAWQIPKGMIEAGEAPVDAARREAREELGVELAGELVPLGAVRQAGGKRVEAFAAEQDVDADAIESNLFEMEWPPKSGRIQSFPEVDRAAWFDLDAARTMMLASQQPLLDRLVQLVDRSRA